MTGRRKHRDTSTEAQLKRARTEVHPVITVCGDVGKEALLLAAGDLRRLAIQEDGSVVVRNPRKDQS